MPEQQPFLFVGNHAALDFVNTLPNHQGAPNERLGNYEDLLRWFDAAGLLGARELAAARRWHGRAGDDALVEARRLRATIHTLASRLADGKELSDEGSREPGRREADAGDDDAIAALNHVLARRTVTRELVALPASSAGGTDAAARFELVTRTPIEQPIDLLAPVAEAAANLLVTAMPRRVRRCEGHACVLFFYDVSKNGARRWCSMSACGNRHKAARHYQRKRAPS